MGGSLAAEKTRAMCEQCGKQFVPGSENTTPSGKFCSAACYRRWVRLKVRHALGVAPPTEAPGVVDRSGV
jgi:hypothetical protein